jgi:hypothetical protein
MVSLPGYGGPEKADGLRRRIRDGVKVRYVDIDFCFPVGRKA